MIPKLTTGNGFGGSLRYDTRQGQGMKPGLAKVLDVSGVEFNIDKDGNYVIDTKQVSRDFRAQTMGYKGDREIRKPVYHWVLSYHPNDNVSEEQMIEDAQEFLKRIGFDDTQYVMTVHYDKAHNHLHIVTNIVNNQGKRIPTMGLIDKAHAAAAAITKERGYTWGEQTKKENITQKKIHKPHDRAREVIEPMIREAIAASTSFHDLQYKLIDEYGIMCNYTVAKDGKRGRLSFCFEYEGQNHPFKASDVARDLSFGFVNEKLSENYKKEQEEIWKEYNAMRPVLTHANEIVTDLFNSKKKQSCQEINSALSLRFDKINTLWRLYKRTNRERFNDNFLSIMLEGLCGGGPLKLPVIFLANTVMLIDELIMDKSFEHSWITCKSKIYKLGEEIEKLEFREFQINERIKGKLKKRTDTIQIRKEINELIVNIKDNLYARIEEARYQFASSKITRFTLTVELDNQKENHNVIIHDKSNNSISEKIKKEVKEEKPEQRLYINQKQMYETEEASTILKTESRETKAVGQKEKVVWEFDSGFKNYRIVKKPDGECHLQKLEFDKSEVDEKGCYCNLVWETTITFSKFEELYRKSSYAYLKIERVNGKIEYVNNNGSVVSYQKIKKIKGGNSLS